MKRTMLIMLFATVVTCLAGPRAHAQLWAGDPLNNDVCSAEMSGTQCLAAGYGGTGTSSGTTICRGDQLYPSTYCYTPTFDANGKRTTLCLRSYVTTGYCRCSSGSMSGSCTMLK